MQFLNFQDLCHRVLFFFVKKLEKPVTKQKWVWRQSERQRKREREREREREVREREKGKGVRGD